MQFLVLQLGNVFRSLSMRVKCIVTRKSILTTDKVIEDIEHLIGTIVTIQGTLLVRGRTIEERSLCDSDDFCLLSPASDTKLDQNERHRIILLMKKTLFEDLGSQGAEMFFGGRYYYSAPAVVTGRIKQQDFLGYRYLLEDISYVEACEEWRRYILS